MVERIGRLPTPAVKVAELGQSKSRIELDESFPTATIDKLLKDPETEKFVAEHEPGLRINEHDIGQSVMDQPDLYYRVSKHLALAISRRDAAKQHLANVEARVDGMTRRAARESDTKRTEDEIKSIKRIHADVTRASNLLLQLTHAAKTIEALEEAYKQRSYAVNKLCDMYIANYYSDATHNSTKTNMREARASDVKRQLHEKRQQQAPRSRVPENDE